MKKSTGYDILGFISVPLSHLFATEIIPPFLQRIGFHLNERNLPIVFVVALAYSVATFVGGMRLFFKADDFRKAEQAHA